MQEVRGPQEDHCPGKGNVGCTGFEPVTSCLSSKRSEPAELTPRKGSVSVSVSVKRNSEDREQNRE